MNIKAMRLYSVALGALLAMSFAPLLNSQTQQAYAFHIDDDELGGGIGVLETKFFVNGKLVDWSETITDEKFYGSGWTVPFFSAGQSGEPLETMRLQAFVRLDPASAHGFHSYKNVIVRVAQPNTFIYPDSDPRGFGVPWNMEKSWFLYQVPGGADALKGGGKVMVFDVVWTPKEIEQAAADCRTLQNSCQRAQNSIGFAVHAWVELQIEVVTATLGIPTGSFIAGVSEISTGYSAPLAIRSDGYYVNAADLLAEVQNPEDHTCNLIVSLFGQCGPDQTPIQISVQDTDNDGLINTLDPDIDNDGAPNETDSDIDGDGLPNGIDQTPTGQINQSNTDTTLTDTDSDGTPNIADNDIDGDGVLNGADPDVDGDGNPNNNDPDIDGDEIRNVDDPDIDGDGATNGRDSTDIDGDGTPNPQDGDIDGDLAPNRQDDDMDGDGILNKFDPDIDGDGLINSEDPDMDSDGVDNERDGDIDGDHIENAQDDLPSGASPTERNLGNQFGENTMILYGSLGAIVAMVVGGGVLWHKRRK